MRFICIVVIIAFTGFGCSDHQEDAPASLPEERGRNFAFGMLWDVIRPIQNAQNEEARRHTDEALKVIEDGLKRYLEKHGEYPSAPEAEPPPSAPPRSYLTPNTSTST